MKLLVTGGAGFIGSSYVRNRLESRPTDRVVVLDKLTYAGHARGRSHPDRPGRTR